MNTRVRLLGKSSTHTVGPRVRCQNCQKSSGPHQVMVGRISDLSQLWACSDILLGSMNMSPYHVLQQLFAPQTKKNMYIQLSLFCQETSKALVFSPHRCRARDRFASPAQISTLAFLGNACNEGCKVQHEALTYFQCSICCPHE